MKGLERDTHLLQELGRYASMNPAEIARAVGVSKSTIWRPATGKSTSRLSQPVLDKLKATFPQFHGWGDYPVTDAGASEIGEDDYSTEQRRWLDLLQDLKPADRQMVLQLAEHFRDQTLNPVPSPPSDAAVDFWGERHERRGR